MINVGLIPPPDNAEKIYHEKGDTDNIIQIVLKGCNADIKKGFKSFCSQFSADEQGLRELWSFIKYRIVYQTDEDGRQDILLPAALWYRGWGDCKSKTVFTVHVLRCLGIPYTVRFTGYAGKSLTHVYCIAHLNGNDIIIDTVFDFYNREKKYKHKKDYNMTKISMISGIGDIDIDRKVKSKMVEIQQKKEYITPQEDIPLSGTVGEARAYLLKRQLELLRAFNADNSKKVEDYNKSIRAVETAIIKGPTKFVISGTAYGEVEAQVKNIINTKLKDIRPAMSFNNTIKSRVSQSRIGAIPPNYLFPIDLTVSGKGCTTMVGRDLCYKLGANTIYKKSADNVFRGVMKYLEDNIGKPILDASGNPVMITTNAFGVNITAPKLKYIIANSQMNTQQFLQYLKALPVDANRMNVLFSMVGPNTPAIAFGDLPTKVAFEKYIEEESGVWQQFLNQTVFKEQGGVGCGVMYHYNDNTGIPANKFGSVINSKKAVQSQWMSAANYLTGADQSIINDMGRNTAIYHLSENPEDALKKLAAASGIVPNVGLDPVTVTLIIGLVSAILSAISSAMANSKRDGDVLDPEKAVGFGPVGQPLMPKEDDWNNIGETDPNSTDPNSGSGLGFDTKTLLGLGLLGVGGYFLMSKGKK
jgi:hypothetical protein